MELNHFSRLIYSWKTSVVSKSPPAFLLHKKKKKKPLWIWDTKSPESSRKRLRNLLFNSLENQSPYLPSSSLSKSVRQHLTLENKKSSPLSKSVRQQLTLEKKERRKKYYSKDNLILNVSTFNIFCSIANNKISQTHQKEKVFSTTKTVVSNDLVLFCRIEINVFYIS